ncbi:MAG TPA: hypothetical protein VIJ31_12170 [Acidothermaceae bacterium]
MVATADAPILLYAGDALTLNVQLAADGVPTDLADGVVSYGIPAAGAPVTLPLSELTHDGAGGYTYTLDTTNLAGGLYAAQIVATGTVDVEYFIIQVPPSPWGVIVIPGLYTDTYGDTY